MFFMCVSCVFLVGLPGRGLFFMGFGMDGFLGRSMPFLGRLGPLVGLVIEVGPQPDPDPHADPEITLDGPGVAQASDARQKALREVGIGAGNVARFFAPRLPRRVDFHLRDGRFGVDDAAVGDELADGGAEGARGLGIVIVRDGVAVEEVRRRGQESPRRQFEEPVLSGQQGMRIRPVGSGGADPAGLFEIVGQDGQAFERGPHFGDEVLLDDGFRRRPLLGLVLGFLPAFGRGLFAFAIPRR